MVQILKANGTPQKIIAQVVGIDEKTLMKHYRTELDNGFATVKASIGAAVIKSALGGNVAAQRFWLLCHGGAEWKFVRPDNDVVIPTAGGETTIIIRGGLAALQPEPPKPNGHDAAEDGENIT